MTPAERNLPTLVAYQRPDRRWAIRLPDGTEKVADDQHAARAYAIREYQAAVRFEAEPLTESEQRWLHGTAER